MSEEKQPARISFAKGKIQNYEIGSTGITGTSKKVSEPTEMANKSKKNLAGDLEYSASDLLYKNIDNLANLLPDINVAEVEQNLEEDPTKTFNDNEWVDDMLEDLSEEEVIKNLNQHLGYRPAKVDLCLRFDENGNSLPQRVIKPEINPYKTEINPYKTEINPYKKRESIVAENIFEPKQPSSSNPIAMPAQNPFITTPPSAKDTFCRSCGSKYLATDNFCGGCGFKRI
jgi:hypothetical protein